MVPVVQTTTLVTLQRSSGRYTAASFLVCFAALLYFK